MNQNQRPHGRKKTVGTGSASFGKGKKVGSGSRPFGFGGRTDSSASGFGKTSDSGIQIPLSQNSGAPSSSGQATRLPSLKLNGKSILILIVVVIAGYFLLKRCGTNLDIPSLLSTGSLSNTGCDYSELSSNDTSSSYTSVIRTVDPSARDKYYTPKSNDDVTVMVYMCGTDLESKYGMASKDLGEMAKAKLSDKVNVIVETGGCKKWQTSGISNSKNQIFKVETGGLRKLEDDMGSSAMTEPKNLSKFINYCTENYEADRYILIFWDHGGGTLSGYGYDEKNPKTSSMTLSRINQALSAANCKFDFIGFDACLMATLETGIVCEPWADYLIASEETEPGTGWYYTNWLTQLSENTSIATIDLSKTIIDDFVSASCSASSGSKVTLSCVDLAELNGTLPDSFRKFSTATTKLLKSDDYKKVSEARSGVRQFSAENRLNQVDFVNLAERIGTKESKDLAKVLKASVKYNKATMSNCNGISIYFPYETTSTVKNAVASYNDLGIDSEYTKCIQSFASLEYSGQIVASASQQSSSSAGGDLLGSLISQFGGGSSSTSPLDFLSGAFGGGSSSAASSSSGFGLDSGSVLDLLSGFMGRSMPAEYDWVDTDLIAENAENISKRYIDPSKITPTEKNGKKVLALTDEEWALIKTVELNVFLGDDEGYMDLGLDNVFDYDEEGNLILDYDLTWLTIDGNLCAYYLVSDTEYEDGSWTTVGRVPALLNGEPVNLRVVFDKLNPEGVVTGAYPIYEEEEGVDVQSKCDIPIKVGDTIEPVCDFYNLDGSYSASYTLDNAFKVKKGGMKIVNLDISEGVDIENISATYRLTDIYGNHYWIEAFID